MCYIVLLCAKMLKFCNLKQYHYNLVIISVSFNSNIFAYYSIVHREIVIFEYFDNSYYVRIIKLCVIYVKLC